jgi:NADPH:quinone reductase-like Zn-dependent oxidoreductase
MAHNRAMGATMKAAIRDRYGPPEVVRVEEVDRPEPVDDQLLVRVVAASVNRGDLDGIVPKPQFVRLFLGLRAPRNHRVGLDAAGVVEAVGPAVTAFKPGDRVFADLYPFGQGSFAEYVAAPERAFARIPDAITFEDAATLPHAGILAVQGLRRRNGSTLRVGDKVLIDGASGNVGPFAVQIAKAMGAEVTGVCRTSKVEFVRSLGADHVIDYTTTDYTRTGERYDWILAADSHHSVLEVRRALKRGGVYTTLGGDGRSIVSSVALGAVVSAATDRSAGLMLWWKPFGRADLDTLERLIAAGQVRPFIDRRYPLDAIVDALRWVDDGHAKGKVVVQVS